MNSLPNAQTLAQLLASSEEWWRGDGPRREVMRRLNLIRWSPRTTAGRIKKALQGTHSHHWIFDLSRMELSREGAVVPRMGCQG